VFGSTDTSFFGKRTGTIIWLGTKIISDGPGWSAKAPALGIVVPLDHEKYPVGTVLHNIPTGAIPVETFFCSK